MSAFSLNRLCNGGGSSCNSFLNLKFHRNASTLPTKKHTPKIELDINNNAPQPAMRRRHLLNRRGSLHHNQFKGVKKELIEKHASLIIHTMTVNLRFASSNVDHVFNENFLFSPRRLRNFMRKFSTKLFTMWEVTSQKLNLRSSSSLCRRLFECKKTPIMISSRRRESRKLPN
jgi:hypothetical protein